MKVGKKSFINAMKSNALNIQNQSSGNSILVKDFKNNLLIQFDFIIIDSQIFQKYNVDLGNIGNNTHMLPNDYM